MSDEYKQGLTDAISLMNIQPSQSLVVDLLLRIKNQSKTIRKIQDRVSEIDDFMSGADIRVSCRGCGNMYTLDYLVSDFDPNNSYCGGSDGCCP